METAEREPEPARADAATPETPAPETPRNANELESVLAAGAVWESGGRPPVGAPAVLLLDPGAGWAEARLAHARLSRAVHPDKCADARAARAFELVTAARGAMAPAVPEDDAHGDAWRLVRDDVVRVDADGEVVVGPRGDVGPLSTAPEGGFAAARAAEGRDARGADLADIEDARDAKEPAPSRPDKGFARAAAEAAASHAASPLQLRTRPRRCPRRACATSSSRGASPRK